MFSSFSPPLNPGIYLYFLKIQQNTYNTFIFLFFFFFALLHIFSRRILGIPLSCHNWRWGIFCHTFSLKQLNLGCFYLCNSVTFSHSQTFWLWKFSLSVTSESFPLWFLFWFIFSFVGYNDLSLQRERLRRCFPNSCTIFKNTEFFKPNTGLPGILYRN